MEKITYKVCLREGYKASMGPISYFLLKPLQVFVAYLIIKLTKGYIHPNWITVSNLFIYPITAFLILKGNIVLAAIVLLFVHDLLDGVDGCIARVLRKTSQLGRLLDNTIYPLIYYVSIFLIAFRFKLLLYSSLLFLILVIIKTVRLNLYEEGFYRKEKYYETRGKIIITQPFPDVVYFMLLVFSLINKLEFWYLYLIFHYLVGAFRYAINILKKW